MPAGSIHAAEPAPIRLADARLTLHDSRVAAPADPGGRVAAVAAILREHDAELQLLFIRRAKRRGDPWSGHMAWPGGKREPRDATLRACAVRETREEIGLDLEQSAEWLGTLRAWQREGSGPRGLRGVFPHVYALTGEGALRLGDEVQEAVWIPLSYFRTWSARRPWSWFAPWLPRVPPAYRYRGRLIWGLTQWMLADLLQRLDGCGSACAAAPTAANGTR